MLGIRFIKVPPTTYLLEYRRGRVVREGAGLKPEQLIGLAFQELAAHADRIGQLNLTPDLLESLLRKPAPRGHVKYVAGQPVVGVKGFLVA